MSQFMDDLLARLKKLEEDVRVLKDATAQSAFDKRLGRVGERATRRAARFSVTVPLNIYADPSPTPAAHASSHLAGGSDPIFTTQAYTISNASTLRALDVTALTAVDADVQKVANVLSTLLADLEAYKVPTL